MCLGIPMQIQTIDGDTAHCEAFGVRRDVNLFLVQDARPAPGDYVLVHVGYAIQVVAPDHAHSAWELYDAMQAGAENPHA